MAELHALKHRPAANGRLCHSVFCPSFNVIPAKAGIHGLSVRPWIPDQVGDDNVRDLTTIQKLVIFQLSSKGLSIVKMMRDETVGSG